MAQGFSANMRWVWFKNFLQNLRSYKARAKRTNRNWSATGTGRPSANQALDQLVVRVKDSADLVNSLKQVR
jgi:hypothetical protein